MQLHCCCYYESLSCWALYIKLYLGTDLHCPQSMQLVRRGTVLFTTDTVQRYFQPPTANLYFQTIPADKCIAPVVVHCVKGHSYSAAGEVLWLYSIALAEELCVKGHSYTHIHFHTQDRSWQGPQQVAFRVWRTDWVNPGQRDYKLCSGITTEWCLKDMLYDSSTSKQRELRELNLLRSALSGIDESYSWIQIKKLLQELVFPWCEIFGTWSSSKGRVDRVPKLESTTTVRRILSTWSSEEKCE